MPNFIFRNKLKKKNLLFFVTASKCLITVKLIHMSFAGFVFLLSIENKKWIVTYEDVYFCYLVCSMLIDFHSDVKIKSKPHYGRVGSRFSMSVSRRCKTVAIPGY